MQIPTYKRQTVDPQPIDNIEYRPDLSKQQALTAWGDVVSNGVPKAAMAVDEAYQQEQDFKFGLIKDDMDSSARQALDGLQDELNKRDPKDLFTNGTFEDYTEPYEQSMAKAREESTGKLKGGMKRRADRYWQQLESANRDLARQIYDKAQKEAGAYCAGQDLQGAVADCDLERANQSIDNAVGAGYITWQEGEKAKEDAKYDIFINGVISGQYFNWEKKDGQKVGINHQVGLDHDDDMKMLEEAREELPSDKYRQLRDYVNHLWDVKARQIADERGNLYIDYYKKIMDRDPSVTLEYIESDQALDPVNLEGCRVDYKARLRNLWKQMNPEEKPAKEAKTTRTNEYTKDTTEKKEKAPSETEIKNFISLAFKRFTSGEIDGDYYMAAVSDMAKTNPHAYSAAKLIYDQADEILKNLPQDYQSKAKVTMESIAEGLNSLVDKNSDTAPELQLEDLKSEAMGRLLDVVYEYSNKEGRKDEFNKACTDLMAIYTTKALSQQEKLAKEPTRTEQSSIPAALKKMGDIEEYGNLIYFNNITGENVWLNKNVGNAFEKAADVTATGISDIVGKSVTWHYDGQDKAKVYFTDSDGARYRIYDNEIYRQTEDGLTKIWPKEEPKKPAEQKKAEGDITESNRVFKGSTIGGW